MRWSIGIDVLSGNRPIFKNESARALLKILRDAGTVGILADQNTMPEEGVFVDFFGKTRVHDDRNRARGSAYRCGGGAWLCLVGRGDRKIPVAI